MSYFKSRCASGSYCAGSHARGAKRRTGRDDRPPDMAGYAGVAAGQLHHHFTSTGELKAHTFVRLIREMLDMPLVSNDASRRERLFSMTGSDDGRLESHIRLWREAQLLADSDSDIKGAYLLTMSMWHEETLKIILA